MIKKKPDNHNAMVALNGAPGDHLHALPALRQFSGKCGELYMTAHWRGGLVQSVYENTGIVDHFVWLDDRKMCKWTEAQIGEYMLRQLGNRSFGRYYDLNGLHGMMASAAEWDAISPAEMREWQDQLTVYDRYSIILNVREAKGLRPKMSYSRAEREWADMFVANIQEPRIVGWQWSGSADVKEFPKGKTQEVLSTLAEQYDDIHILALGSERFSDVPVPDRCTNLAGHITWRQATLLTSKMQLYIAPDTSVMVAAQGFPDVPKILLATTTSGKEVAFPETTIIQSPVSCSPCYRIVKTCKKDTCCDKIPMSALLAGIDHILESDLDAAQ